MQLFLGQPRQLTQHLIDEPPRNQLFSTLINLTFDFKAFPKRQPVTLT